MKTAWKWAVAGALVIGTTAVAQTYEPYQPRFGVKVGGGIEGYRGALDALVDPGPTWGVSVEARPLRILGVELAYTGATSEVDESVTGSDAGLIGGPDIVRNGGQAALTIGTPTVVQAYGLAGIGFDYYAVRGNGGDFNNDASGAIPLGVGLRGNAANFNADLRLTYSSLFSDDFAGNDIDATGFSDGRYAATLHVGGVF